ncbi:hypothetical protein [Succinimonas sp.]|uniref:hypothetical protein n=1 Tax=Succinimonas sp. TaxID=1936151 RepID=UPI003867204A
MDISKLFFRDQDGAIYELSDGVLDWLKKMSSGGLPGVRSDATIRDYDYDAVINDLAGASAGNVSIALERLLDRDTLMPSEDAAKIIRNVPANDGSIDKLYRSFRLFSDKVPWFGEGLSMLMELKDEGDVSTLAAMKFKILAGSKQIKPGENLSRFLRDVFRQEEDVFSQVVFTDRDDISFTKEHLLKFATFWVILSEKLSAAYTTKGQ